MTRTFTCEDCLRVFPVKPECNRTKRCTECKKIYLEEYQREYSRKYREAHPQVVKAMNDSRASIFKEVNLQRHRTRAEMDLDVIEGSACSIKMFAAMQRACL